MLACWQISLLSVVTYHGTLSNGEWIPTGLFPHSLETKAV